ncbi:hypothetical protein M0802_002208 [Mischocyttarus mexicanus]|nr:hypothetical protein M0802_002208 [Mischocyttarus mexicanus]
MIEMKYLIIVLISAFMIDATITNNTIEDNNVNINLYHNSCGCIQYDCGCCQYFSWKEVSLHGLLCSNVTYLDKEYGFSMTVTYNDFTLINETISARNPPPVCFGEYIIPNLKAEICLRLYDININKTDIHGCFDLEGRIMRMKILPIKLGCFDTKIKMTKVINETENMIKKVPFVTMM